MSIKVHEMKSIEFIDKKSIFNEQTDFMNEWRPQPPTDYIGYLKVFLETINKNQPKMESMADSIIPIFLLTLGICLLVVGVAISIIRKSPVYITIVAAAVILFIINVVIEVKKRGEIENVAQDIKVQAEILKTKSEGQLEMTIIKPVPKGCFIFSAHRYFIKLILKYQSINENKQINMVNANDPFAMKMNNFVMNSNPELPGQKDVFDIPMQEIQLYQPGGKAPAPENGNLGTSPYPPANIEQYELNAKR